MSQLLDQVVEDARRAYEALQNGYWLAGMVYLKLAIDEIEEAGVLL